MGPMGTFSYTVMVNSVASQVTYEARTAERRERKLKPLITSILPMNAAHYASAQWVERKGKSDLKLVVVGRQDDWPEEALNINPGKLHLAVAAIYTPGVRSEDSMAIHMCLFPRIALTADLV